MIYSGKSIVIQYIQTSWAVYMNYHKPVQNSTSTSSPKSSSLTFRLTSDHGKRLHCFRAPPEALPIDFVQVKVSVINFMKIMDLKYWRWLSRCKQREDRWLSLSRVGVLPNKYNRGRVSQEDIGNRMFMMMYVGSKPYRKQFLACDMSLERGQRIRSIAVKEWLQDCT